MSTSNGAIAFAIVCSAGASTAIGGSVVFFPILVKPGFRKVLASGLGFSAGVMIYISLGEIVQKSNEEFLNSSIPESLAYAYATLSFFGGVFFACLINCVVHTLSGAAFKRCLDCFPCLTPSAATRRLSITTLSTRCSRRNAVITGPHCASCFYDVEERYTDWNEILQGATLPPITEEDELSEEENELEENKSESEFSSPSDESGSGEVAAGKRREQKLLVEVGVKTAICIALHNFPEGLATFIAALADPAAGAVLAVAIAVHNIPEGVSVAMPIFYATRNKWKAFFCAFASGMTEPLAALLGWVALAGYKGDILYGTMFGLAGGMMVLISCKEILPLARRFDAADSVVTLSFVLGMAIMAVSIALFSFYG